MSQNLLTVASAVTSAIVGIERFVASYSKLGDHIDKQSQKLGLSRQEYQELNYVLSQSGTSIDTFGSSMNTLNQQIQAAVSGNKQSVKAFRDLDISLSDLRNKSTSDIFKDVIAGLQNMEQGAKQSATAQKLLGENSRELGPLLNAGAGAIEKMSEEAHNYGIVVGDEAIDRSVEFTKAVDTLKKSAEAAGQNLAAGLSPAFTVIIEALAGVMSAVSQFGQFLQHEIGRAHV